MVEWVLDTNYADRFSNRPDIEEAVIVWDNNEGSLLALMQRIEREHPGVKVFSLPSVGDDNVNRHLELGVRGDPDRIGAAMEEIRAELRRLGSSFSEQKKPQSETGV